MSSIEQYRDHLIMRGRTPATIKAYVGAVHQLERFAGKPIQAVTPADAARWVRQPHLRQGSRNAYHRWLAAWCAWSGQDLLSEVDRPRRPECAPKPVPPFRVELMLAACRDDQDTAMLLLMLLAGLRRMEVASFRGEQIDPHDRMILVRGKGGKDAWVPAPPALVRHARRMPPRRYWFPSPVSPGMPVAPFTIWKRTTDLSARAGVGHIPPHRLRHTYATELVRGGAPLTSVQRMMRHANLATTQHYIGVSAEDLHAAGAVLPWAA